jgi:hypothetical protein
MHLVARFLGLLDEPTEKHQSVLREGRGYKGGVYK